MALQHAEERGANAVVGVRYDATEVMSSVSQRLLAPLEQFDLIKRPRLLGALQQNRIDGSLAEVETPVLILRGVCDYCVPEVAGQYDELLPNSTLVDVNGAGHFLWLERPDVLSEVVGSFLSEGALDNRQE